MSELLPRVCLEAHRRHAKSERDFGIIGTRLWIAGLVMDGECCRGAPCTVRRLGLGRFAVGVISTDAFIQAPSERSPCSHCVVMDGDSRTPVV